MSRLNKAVQASELVTVLSNGDVIASTVSKLRYVFAEGTRCIERFFITEDDQVFLDIVRNMQLQLKGELGASFPLSLPHEPTPENVCEAAVKLLDHARQHGFELVIAPACTLQCTKGDRTPQVHVSLAEAPK